MASQIVNLITKLREDGMRARLRSLTVAAVAVTLVAGAALTSAWAQGEWKAPADAKAMKNPVKGIGNAKKNVETNCVTCHGASGKGDGPAAAALPPPKPADWTSPKIQAESDGELFWKISNGRGAMPQAPAVRPCGLRLIIAR